ncbi:MAG: ASKHA domain-containing protein [Coriobacteriales bacterium]|jgi:uncharacterized 2Fe-2S/4Fe-4S cluster protein (DUF4445 family)
MKVKIVTADGATEVEAREGQTVLSLIQEQGIHFLAPCGGNGKCGKCRVLLRTEEGLEYHLACQTKVEDGMKIILSKDDSVMTISETGFSTPYEVDKGEPGEYGLAIDVGTTTVVCHLHDLGTGKRLASASCPNPQIVFGSDVISRINASMNGKLPAMQNVIDSGLIKLKDEAFASAGIEVKPVKKAVLAGNTTMEHIATGLSPDSIGVNPFTPLSLFGDVHKIEGLCDNTYIMPCVAGYVGGDITSGAVATGLIRKEKPCVFVDVGTNGEMIVGCKDRMISCATAAGPAFEGANIECGMPASPGGISKVRLGNEKLEFDVVSGIDPVGICGSGLIDTLAIMLDLGVIDETGLILDPDEIDSWASELVGEVHDDNAIFLSREHNVYVTQKDVRNIQLAKAAVCAGVWTLLDEYGIGIDDVDQLLIAGGFGAHIDLPHATRIGLFPRELLDRAKAVGNSAGEGASAVLISQEARDVLAEVKSECEYIELSLSKNFNEHYVDQMTFDED